MPVSMPSAGEVRTVLLEAIAGYGGGLSVTPVLDDAVQRLRDRHHQYSAELVLTVFYDLFRSGHLSWGLNISNPSPPWFHTTNHGRAALRSLSRDPANPDGYLSHLRSRTTVSDLAMAYVVEALRCYNGDCPRAAAVMLGCAAESTLLALRDAIVTRLGSLSHSIPSGLDDWRAKRVLDATRAILEANRASMPNELRESFDACWSGFSHSIRTSRNDAGHPSDVSAVSEESVHATLLMFPELATLSSRLTSWVAVSLEVA